MEFIEQMGECRALFDGLKCQRVRGSSGNGGDAVIVHADSFEPKGRSIALPGGHLFG